MRMDDETLKRILQEGMDYDADCIMREVNSDPNLQEVVIPEDMDANIKEEIDRIKAAQAQEQEKQAQEEQELIRLGKLYKKKRARNKYIILIAAVVCALGIGTISFGDGKKVFTEIKRALTVRERTVINAGHDENSFAKDIADEAEAFEEIEKMFGFVPVKMYYMPEGMRFEEAVMEEELQLIHLYYTDSDEKSISMRIMTNHRSGSVSADVEDEVLKEYVKEVEGININIKEHKIEDITLPRWSVCFTYSDAQYSIILMGIDSLEVDQIIDNLHFL